MEKIKTIKIKKDWDYQPHIDDERGHHILRTNEQRILTDFLARRNEGALLGVYLVLKPFFFQ